MINFTHGMHMYMHYDLIADFLSFDEPCNFSLSSFVPFQDKAASYEKTKEAANDFNQKNDSIFISYQESL
jgi:hypothetical protein